MANNTVLDQVMSQILADPSKWAQDFWRCETGFCYAGWTAELSKDVEWEGDYDNYAWNSMYLNILIPLDQFYTRYPYVDHNDVEQIRQLDGSTTYQIYVRQFAAAALELTDKQGTNLFRSTNSLEDLQAMVKELHNNPNAELWDTEETHRDSEGTLVWNTNCLPVNEFDQYDSVSEDYPDDF